MNSTGLSDSTKRMLRTWYQAIITGIVVVPVLLTMFPNNDQIVKVSASVLAAIGVISKVVNLLEEKGLIPAWLKPDTSLPGVVPGTLDEPKAPEDMSDTEEKAAEELGTVPVDEPIPPVEAKKAVVKKTQSAAVRNRQGRR